MTTSRRSIARLVNFVLVVGIAAAALYLTLLVIFPDAVARRTIAVPSLAGLSEAAALDTLVARRLEGRAVGSVADSAVAEGQVATQEPAAGTMVRRRTLVRFSLSAGPAYAHVPDVRHADLPTAKAQIVAAGLVPGLVDSTRDTVPAGMVVETHPEAGASTRRGTVVGITVSEGTASIVVPALAGLTERAARARLDSLGLRVGTIRRVSEGVAGTVYGQRPEAGARLAQGGEVELILSEARP